MPRGRGGLGRGLESLFEDAAPSLETGDGVRTVPLREIEPDPGQPRKTFNQDSLAELAASIGEHGLLQPIAVRPQPMGGYRIVAGERRWRACRMAGLTEVPVVVRDVSDQEAMELALVENLQREDLNPIEVAEGCHQLIEKYGLTQETAAKRLGKSRSALANSLRLLGLPPEALELLRSGALTAGHAKALLGLSDAAVIEAAAQQIEAKGMNVRQAEALCRKLAKDAKQAGQAPAPEPPPRPALPVEVEESLRQALGSEVSVAYKNGRGSLTVHFYSDDQLRAFANLLGHYDLEGTGPAPVDQALWEQT